MTFLDEALHAAFHDVPHASPEQGGVGWTVSAAARNRRVVPAARSAPAAGAASAELFAARTACWSGSSSPPRILRSATPNCGSREKARASTARRGPKAHYLGPLHPVLDWASDRALTALGRNQVFVIRGDVDAPTVLLMGTLTNKRGQLISRVFSTAVFPNPANPEFCVVEPLEDLSFLRTRDGA